MQSGYYLDNSVISQNIRMRESRRITKNIYESTLPHSFGSISLTHMPAVVRHVVSALASSPSMFRPFTAFSCCCCLRCRSLWAGDAQISSRSLQIWIRSWVQITWYQLRCSHLREEALPLSLLTCFPINASCILSVFSVQFLQLIRSSIAQ